MLLREKGKADAAPVRMEWGQAQTALQTGNYEVVPEGGDRGPDQPAAQSPSPGTPPKDAVGSPDLDAMTVAQLHAFASERSFDLGSAKTKQELVEAIRAKLAIPT